MKTIDQRLIKRVYRKKNQKMIYGGLGSSSSQRPKKKVAIWIFQTASFATRPVTLSSKTYLSQTLTLCLLSCMIGEM